MKEKILENMHKITAGFLLLFGAAALYFSLRDLKFGTITSPQGGMAPILFSAGIVVFSIPNLILEWRRPAGVPEKLQGVNWLKWFFYLLICALYVFLINKIGFAADTFLGLFAMLKLAGQKHWVKPIAISAVFTILCWALFTYAMSVKLPAASWF